MQAAQPTTQLALIPTDEADHDANGTSEGRGVRGSLFLRRKKRVLNPSSFSCDNAQMALFPGVESPVQEEQGGGPVTMRSCRAQRRARPIRVDPRTLANQRHRIGLFLRAVLPSYKGVQMVVEALRLQGRYGGCYASARHLAGRAGASARTWWRVLKLLRDNGLAVTERLVNMASGRLSVNLLDLSGLWRFLVLLLCSRTPYSSGSPGCWVADVDAQGVLRVPDRYGWLCTPAQLLSTVPPDVYGPETMPYFQKQLNTPPAWTQPWWLEWVVKMNDAGAEWVFPTVRAKAEAIRAEFAG